jgi:hypothetical protein
MVDRVVTDATFFACRFVAACFAGVARGCGEPAIFAGLVAGEGFGDDSRANTGAASNVTASSGTAMRLVIGS